MRLVCCRLVGFCLVGLIGAAPVWGALKDVQPGDSEARLLEEVGKPAGKVQAGSRTVLSYPAGRVVVENGRVTAIELKNPEAEIQRQERLIRREEAEKAQDEARVARGHEVKAMKLKDPSFRRLPAETRLNYWLQFNRHYPEVELAGVLQSLYREMDRESEWKNVQVRTERYPRYYRRYYYVPGYRVNYGGQRNRSNTGRANEKDPRSGIVEFDKATLFSPDIKGLPGGKIR